jgi:glycosyltransferase involved in cell wall biosynthesis
MLLLSKSISIFDKQNKSTKMNILSIHNRYQIRGGEDESRESEERLLKENGHRVDVYEKSNEELAQISAIKLGLNTIWSRQEYQAITDQLLQHQYDIVHIQNFFPLISPAAHHAVKKQGVPVVQTLRNYRLLCPNALFFRDGRVCEDCLDKPLPYPGILHRCYRDDWRASSVTASMISIHRALKTWHHMVDRFITLTHFARSKFIEGGFPEEKIVVKPNFVHPDPGVGPGSGNYALFVGRLSVEKGLDTLLKAWSMLESPLPLKIIGDGPLAGQVQKAAQKVPEIEWLGRRPIRAVHELMGNAKFLIFPSEWYETFGRVAVEAFSKGTPVVAANIGAIAELVEDGHTGRLFSPSDSADLACKVNWMLDNGSKVSQMRQAARAEFEAKYTAETNYRCLLDIYQTVLD